MKIWIYKRLRSYRWKKIQPLLDKSSQSLLDIGCQGLYFHDQLKNIYQVTLADYEPRHDCIIKEDVQQLRFEDNAFDIVLCQQVLEHVPDPVKAIKEIYRILKPGGKLIITDLDEHNFDFLRKEHNDHWMGFKRDDIKKWFVESGFKNVIVDCAGEKCYSDSYEGEERAEIGIFVAYGEK